MSTINQCTRCITGETKLVQYYRLCLTCSAVGVCLNCVGICHENHQLGPVLREKFFCQCQQITHCCRALNLFDINSLMDVSGNSSVPSSVKGTITTAASTITKKRKYNGIKSEKFSVWTRQYGDPSSKVSHTIHDNKEDANIEVKKKFIEENPWSLDEKELYFKDTLTITNDEAGFLMMKITDNNGEALWEAGAEYFMEGNKINSHHAADDIVGFSMMPPEKKAKAMPIMSKAISLATAAGGGGGDDNDDDDEMVVFTNTKPRYDVDFNSEMNSVADKTMTNDKKKKVTRPKKEIGAPKGPVASFMMFSNAQREKVVQDNPKMSMADISRTIGQLWKALTPEEKVPYEKLAKKDKERYVQEMEEFKRKKLSGEFIPPPIPVPKVKAKPGPKPKSSLLSNALVSTTETDSVGGESISNSNHNTNHNIIMSDTNTPEKMQDEVEGELLDSEGEERDEQAIIPMKPVLKVENDKELVSESDKEDETYDLEEELIAEEEQQKKEQKSMKKYVVYSIYNEGKDGETATETVIDGIFPDFRTANQRVKNIFFKENFHDLNEETMEKDNMEEQYDDNGFLTLSYHLSENPTRGIWKVGVREDIV